MDIRLSLVSIVIALLALTGCATAPKNVVFVTSTSIGINVDNTAASASFAHDRVEGYYAPRYKGKSAPPVYADLETNGSLINRKIRQVYATGDAAGIVLGLEPNKQVESTKEQVNLKKALLQQNDSFSLSATADTEKTDEGDNGIAADKTVMFFGTNTTAGFKVGFGAAAINNFILGYKRNEISVIPAGPKASDYPSVLAALDIDEEPSRENGKADVKQFFATGVAANELAKKPEIKTALESKAQSRLAAFREDERLQNSYVRAGVNCFTGMQDKFLKEVADNIVSLRLFKNDSDAVAGALRNADEIRTARKAYINKIVQLDPDSSYYTGLLRGHAIKVCELAKIKD
ncbi:hypothetical protein SAMN05518865_1414 [Duganella sp. CF458]|uniref:hypothetical protein n=1 Tax=Duganella sp. CF458 TaxID=1884368 RepID=UPI0008F41C0D|nr:hypothetical protein [Duganella sp. CF458]SFH04171.1 hypothetical protein SAMN05518865_1414 [Duganella sp. CF458]